MQASDRLCHSKDKDKKCILGQGIGMLLCVVGACSSIVVGPSLSSPWGEKHFLLESTSPEIKGGGRGMEEIYIKKYTFNIEKYICVFIYLVDLL